MHAKSIVSRGLAGVCKRSKGSPKVVFKTASLTELMLVKTPARPKQLAFQAHNKEAKKIFP